MPFDQDNAWPAGLLTIFEHARAKKTSSESRYYGPYDKLLNYCFLDTFKFYVAPQKPPTDDMPPGPGAVNCIIFLVVFDQNGKPVMIVEIKNDTWAARAEHRYRADRQMRERYQSMLDECPIPRLWDLSLLGTSMRVYCGDKASYNVNPPTPIPRLDPDRLLLPSFLAGEWDLEILSQKGFAKMKEIVGDILAHT